MTPVVGAAPAQLGHAGRDGGQRGLGRLPAPPAPGQLLNVGQGEQAPASLRLGV